MLIPEIDFVFFVCVCVKPLWPREKKQSFWMYVSFDLISVTSNCVLPIQFLIQNVQKIKRFSFFFCKEDLDNLNILKYKEKHIFYFTAHPVTGTIIINSSVLFSLIIPFRLWTFFSKQSHQHACVCVCAYVEFRRTLKRCFCLNTNIFEIVIPNQYRITRFSSNYLKEKEKNY